MSTPPLSILLPNYNHVGFLPRSLDAILGQSFGDFELVVIDDASTDGSVELLEDYARRDGRVRFYRNPKNAGVIATLNRALSLARGEWVFGAASDDFILPGYFASAFDLLRVHPHAGACLGMTQCVLESGLSAGDTPGAWAEEPRYLSPAELAGVIGICGVTGTAIWGREKFLAAGGYNPALRWHCDWFPLQVLAARHGVCFIPERTAVCRMTTGSYSAGQGQPLIQRQVLRRLLTELAAPQFRDVVPWFERSGVLRQFAADIVRAAATWDAFPAVLLGSIRDVLFHHAKNLLGDLDPGVGAGVARLLGRYGAPAMVLDDRLAAFTTSPVPSIAAAAKEARATIWKATPPGRRMVHAARCLAGRVLRAFDRFSRPLHHRRLEHIELLLTELVAYQKEIHGGMLHVMAKMDGLRQVWEAGATADAPRKAA